jgi:hypothetical protein
MGKLPTVSVFVSSLAAFSQLRSLLLCVPDIPALEPMLAVLFGDFVARVGFAALRSYADSYVPADKMGKLPTVTALMRVQLRV